MILHNYHSWGRSQKNKPNEHVCTNVIGFRHIVPGGSDGKESIYSVGDIGSIPGLGRSRRGQHGFPLQYSCASLVAQLVKNLPTVWETWVLSLGWEDPVKKGKATYSSILA